MSRGPFSRVAVRRLRAIAPQRRDSRTARCALHAPGRLSRRACGASPADTRSFSTASRRSPRKSSFWQRAMADRPLRGNSDEAVYGARSRSGSRRQIGAVRRQRADLRRRVPPLRSLGFRGHALAVSRHGLLPEVHRPNEAPRDLGVIDADRRLHLLFTAFRKLMQEDELPAAAAVDLSLGLRQAFNRSGKRSAPISNAAFCGMQVLLERCPPPAAACGPCAGQACDAKRRA